MYSMMVFFAMRLFDDKLSGIYDNILIKGFIIMNKPTFQKREGLLLLILLELIAVFLP